MATGSIDTHIDTVIKKMCKGSFVKRNRYRSLIVTFEFAENGCAESPRSPSDAAAAEFAADYALRTYRISPQLALLTHWLAPHCSGLPKAG